MEQRLEQLARVGDGWVNLVPGTEEPGDEEQGPGLFSIFGTRRPGGVECTWMPPSASAGTGADLTIGILHPRGVRAAPVLAEAGCAVDAGWRVVQDHPRRGLVVRVPAAVPVDVLLRWVLRAGEVLSVARLTGRWQATVHLPSGG